MDDLLKGVTGRGSRGAAMADRLVALRQLVERGRLSTLEPLLPLCFTLQGKPYHLKDHFPFSPLFKTRMPKTIVVKSGRQVSKTVSQASQGVLLSNCIPFFRTLYIAPRYEQIRKFSNNVVRPFIELSPLRSLWTGTSVENSVLQRSFLNRSMMMFSFALLDADRIRGVSADALRIDELQDMDPSHLPIIRETLSYSKYGLQALTGTPKSLDNPLEGIWQRSSQAEWVIPCVSCGTWNIPSREHHLDAMVGPWHSDISEKCPATVCHKCRRPIFPRHGHWLHRYRERRHTMAGYHVPQIIMPLHYSTPSKWSELLAKREGAGNMTTASFYNEVMGESVDVGQKLINVTELKRAACLAWKNDPRAISPEVLRRLKDYSMKVLSVDWGGGGESGTSFTTLVLLGYYPTGEIHALWGKRMVLSQEHLKEALEILHWMRVTQADFLAHDYTGAGVVRETVMAQAGFPLERVIPVQYVRAATKSLMTFVPATPTHNRDYYRLDKTRSLLYMFTGLKLKRIKTFEYDFVDPDRPGLLHDLLSLVEEKSETRLAGDIYTITRNPMFPDDFAQALNVGCAVLWQSNNAWPDYAKAANVGRITRSQEERYGSRNYGWENTNGGFFEQP